MKLRAPLLLTWLTNTVLQGYATKAACCRHRSWTSRHSCTYACLTSHCCKHGDTHLRTEVARAYETQRQVRQQRNAFTRSTPGNRLWSACEARRDYPLVSRRGGNQLGNPEICCDTFSNTSCPPRHHHWQRQLGRDGTECHPRHCKKKRAPRCHTPTLLSLTIHSFGSVMSGRRFPSLASSSAYRTRRQRGCPDNGLT